ncbi:hypothetical protein DN407_30335 (plasmid) [Bacillus sp. JAS24-2]|nr:hypothetical protein DN407_30335 [Bacillus sp. JAS24-2]
MLSLLHKKRRLTTIDIHLPPKIGVLHLHIFEEGVFCWRKDKTYGNSQNGRVEFFNHSTKKQRRRKARF